MGAQIISQDGNLSQSSHNTSSNVGLTQGNHFSGEASHTSPQVFGSTGSFNRKFLLSSDPFIMLHSFQTHPLPLSSWHASCKFHFPLTTWHSSLTEESSQNHHHSHNQHNHSNHHQHENTLILPSQASSSGKSAFDSLSSFRSSSTANPFVASSSKFSLSPGESATNGLSTVATSGGQVNGGNTSNSTPSSSHPLSSSYSSLFSAAAVAAAAHGYCHQNNSTSGSFVNSVPSSMLYPHLYGGLAMASSGATTSTGALASPAGVTHEVGLNGTLSCSSGHFASSAALFDPSGLGGVWRPYWLVRGLLDLSHVVIFIVFLVILTGFVQ